MSQRLSAPEIKPIELPAEAVAALAAVKREGHHNAHIWQPWEDEVIKRHWHDKAYTHRALCRDVLHISENTVRHRAEELGIA